MRRYSEIAKKYTLLGKKPEELAVVLKSLNDAGGTAYADMIGLLDSNLALVRKAEPSASLASAERMPAMTLGGKLRPRHTPT